MAEIVAAMATGHTPGLCGWFDDAPPEHQEMALCSFKRMRDCLAAAEPDLLIIFANDHLLNWPLSNTPEYTVGIDGEHEGPAEWYDEWLQMDKYRVQGHGDLARHIVNAVAKHGIAFASKRQMQFDDGFSVPLSHLNPGMHYPFIPISMNCTVPPIPSPARAYHVGQVMGEVLRAYPGDERIALIGSGGLSHEPGGPRYFFIDEDFDRWFLEMLEAGDHQALIDTCTLERMERAGSGGTAELIAWFAVLAATRGPAEVLGYAATHAWRAGTGMVLWPELLH